MSLHWRIQIVNGRRIRVEMLGLLLTLAGCAREKVNSTQEGSVASIRATVASQASAELAIWPAPIVVDGATVLLEQGPRVGAKLLVHRGWIPRDHWHAYQVGVSGATMLPLGGFQNPDLVLAASLLDLPGTQDSELRGIAEKLTVLADPNGAVQYAFLTPMKPGILRDTWARNVPSTWPTDTVFQTGNGNWQVRLTFLSRDTRSFTQSWVPSAYAFIFDSAGRLQSWSRRMGEPFAESSIPVSVTSEPWGSSTRP